MNKALVASLVAGGVVVAALSSLPTGPSEPKPVSVDQLLEGYGAPTTPTTVYVEPAPQYIPPDVVTTTTVPEAPVNWAPVDVYDAPTSKIDWDAYETLDRLAEMERTQEQLERQQRELEAEQLSQRQEQRDQQFADDFCESNSTLFTSYCR